jgi:hypothetical protein
VKLALASLVALVTTCAGSGCLNVDPVDFTAPDTHPLVSFDTSIDETSFGDANDEVDAELDGGDVDTTLGCYACIAAPDDPGPGCGTEFAACEAEPKCKAIMDCVLATGCFYLASTKEFTNCAIPCAIEAGVTSTDDPVVILGLNVAYCADKVCRPYCGGGETGS